MLHALPVLRGLRRRYPDAVIDWLVSSPFAPLLENHPDLSHVVLFDRRRFGRLGRSARVTADFVVFLRALRRRAYDLVIDLQGLFRTGFLARASGAPVRVGFADAREGAWAFYTVRLPSSEPDTHAVDRNYRVADLLGFGDVPIMFNMALADAFRQEAACLLTDTGVEHDERLIVVAPGARWETKVWLPERFAETVDALHSADEGCCVLVGGPEEVHLCEQIAARCKVRPVNLAGRTTLPQLAAVIERADCVMCHDSGAMHLAVALGRPVVCLVGPTNPRRTGPYGRLDDVVQLELDCTPCYFRRLAQCPHGHRCMRELETQPVVEAVRKALSVAIDRG